MIAKGITILFFLTIITWVFPSEAGVVLPRMGAVIELDKVNLDDPWEDRASRVQWVLARLNSEGLRVYLLDPQGSAAGCEVIYLDGPAFKGTLDRLNESKIVILQSASRKLFKDHPSDRTVQVSSRVSLNFHKTGSRHIVTVSPDLADCFNDYQAIRALSDAILWLTGLPKDIPRIAPFPHGKRSAVVFIVHGEGYPEKIPVYQRLFLNEPAALTYAVSEDAIRKYPQIIQTFKQSSLHEVAIHNHELQEHGTQDKVLFAHIQLHQEILAGPLPKGLVGPYLVYFDDLREALVKHRFKWFLDKDLPYPMNIPASADAEPVIDITESLKPYDGWWKLQDAEALWRLGLDWKRLKNEMAVCSWHDVHMGKNPMPFLGFIRHVKSLPDVWQTTALDFQSFWRDRWRVRVEILSSDDRSVTVHTTHAPTGLTLTRHRNNRTEIAILKGNSEGKTRLEWKPLPSIEEPQISESMMVRWSPVGSTMPRNGLDTEFAIVNSKKEMIRDKLITVTLPEELRARLGRALPTTLRVSTYGVKGLKFEDLKSETFPKGASIPTGISFKVDFLPGQSIRFYRLRFPIKEKLGRLARLQQSLLKRPFLAAGMGVAVLVVMVFLTLGIVRRYQGR